MSAAPSPRRAAVALTAALALAAGPADARSWRTQDSIGGTLSALMGGVVGVVGGTFAGGILGALALLPGRSPAPADSGGPPPNTIDHSGIVLMIGAGLGGIVGGTLGAPTGAWLFGDSRDFDGSWLASVGGGLGGAVVGGGLGYLIGELTDDGCWLALGAATGLIAGSVAGYALTASDTRAGTMGMPLTIGGTF